MKSLQAIARALLMQPTLLLFGVVLWRLTCSLSYCYSYQKCRNQDLEALSCSLHGYLGGSATKGERSADAAI